MSCEVSGLQVVEARPEQAGEVADVITEAATWCALELGPKFNDLIGPFPEACVRESMRIGKVLVGELAGRVVSTITLNDSDPAVWDDDKAPVEALYLSAFALTQEMRGQGVGRQMLAEVDLVSAAANKSHLRLEFRNSNSKLREHFVDLGFKTKGTKRMGCCYVAARYERAVRPF